MLRLSPISTVWVIALAGACLFASAKAEAQQPAPDGQPTPIVGDPVAPPPQQQPPPAYPPAQQAPPGYGYQPAQPPPPVYGQGGVYAPAPGTQPAPAPKGGRTRVGLIIAGALTFGIPYIITALIGYMDFVIGDGHTDWGELFIPAVGPLFLLPDADTTIDPLLVVDSVVQTAGIVMLAIGIFVPTSSDQVAANAEGSLMAYPLLAHDRAGIGFGGRF